MTFLDLKNAVCHLMTCCRLLRFPMLYAVLLFHLVSCYEQQLTRWNRKTWETQPIPFRKGVFQGDTLSFIILLLRSF